MKSTPIYRQWTGTISQLIEGAKKAHEILEENTNLTFDYHIEVDVGHETHHSYDVDEISKLAADDRHLRSIRIAIEPLEPLNELKIEELLDGSAKVPEPPLSRVLIQADTRSPGLSFEVEGVNRTLVVGLVQQLEGIFGRRSFRARFVTRTRLLLAAAGLALIVGQLADPVESWIGLPPSPDSYTGPEALVLACLLVPTILFGGALWWLFPDFQLLKTESKTRGGRTLAAFGALVLMVATSAVGTLLIGHFRGN